MGFIVMEYQPARKRRRLSAALDQASANANDVEDFEAVASSSPDASPQLISNVTSATDNDSNLKSLGRSISPPSARRTPRMPEMSAPSRMSGLASVAQLAPNKNSNSSSIKMISSPVQLSQIQELPATSNVDAVSLKDILGDPLIKECWAFNYLFDIDFLM